MIQQQIQYGPFACHAVLHNQLANVCCESIMTPSPCHRSETTNPSRSAANDLYVASLKEFLA